MLTMKSENDAWTDFLNTGLDQVELKKVIEEAKRDNAVSIELQRQIRGE